ncbi:MAG: hypothetical protein H6Q13_3131 [Bacteroidetes bacterium]|nr:hypothetical protein [Bacteroidota bacterium]
MKKNIYHLLILLSLFISLFSCKEGEPVEANRRFGSLTVELAELPGTPVMDVYFNDQKLPDSLMAGISYGLSPKLLLDAGTKSKLAFKKHGTDSLLIDTLVAIPTADVLNFRLAYSEDLGLKTFLEVGSSINADSVEIQIFNNLTTLLPDGISVDAYLTREHNDGSGTIDDLAVLPNLNRKNISRAIVVAWQDTNGIPYTYVIRLKNKANDLFLIDDLSSETSFFRLDSSARGKTSIISLVQIVQRGKNIFSNSIAIL